MFPSDPQDKDPKFIEFKEFYDRVLAPFDDDAMMTRQLFAENIYLRKNPGLRQDIGTLLRSDDDQSVTDMVELIDMSRQVDSPISQTPFRAVMSQLTFAREINDIKIDTVGLEASSVRVNTLAQLIRRAFVDAIPDDQIPNFFYTTGFIDQTITAMKTGLLPKQKEWILAKNEAIHNYIVERHRFNQYFDLLPGDDPEQVSAEQVSQDDETIAALFSQLYAKRRYGLKIGYKQQNFQSGSLVYATAPDSNQVHHLLQNKGSKTPIAVVTDTSIKSFNKKISENIAATEHGQQRIGLNIEGRVLFVLLDNGELSSFETGNSLSQMAARHGSYNGFRQLQAEILAGYIDLTGDAKVSEVERTIKSVSAVDADYKKESGVDTVGRLLLPRLKVVSGEASIPIDTTNSRQVRLHGVVWHIRKLPEGWHASPEAVALANEAHITLGDGETFVKGHVRGTKELGEVVTHQLVQK